MSAALLASLISALVSIGGRIAGKEFLEAVLVKVLVFSLDKLTPMTSNNLDDQIAAEIKKRLGQ